MNRAAPTVMVVGGGVIGTACAHYLNQRNWKVVVVERGEFGMACSHGNCGLVCPSHVLPLAEPGAVRQAIRALFAKDAAFSIRPRMDLSLWIWLYKFARRCNRRDMLEAGCGIQALLDSSLQLYHQLLEHDQLQCEWQSRGLLFAYRSSAALEQYGETNELLSTHFHAPARKLNAGDLQQLEPALKQGLAGGWYYDHDAHLRPDKLMSSWRSLLESRQVQFVEGCEVRGFRTDQGRAHTVETSQGTFATDAVVVATGALTPRLADYLGCAIPIQPGKGYSITMPRPDVCPQIPMIFPEHRVAVTPMESGYRLGSIMEFAGFDTSIDPERVEQLKRGASFYLQQPYCDPLTEQWYGWRPMTYDSLPIIDRSPIMNNVWIAAGHNMLGLSMAPATGRLISELVDQQPPHVDIRPYRVSRF